MNEMRGGDPVKGRLVPRFRDARGRCTVLTLSTVFLFAVGVALSSSIRTGASGWREAAAGYRIELPRDHASHPEFKIEWWYYTGNVYTTAGRRFGYQVTFFRVGIDPAPANP